MAQKLTKKDRFNQLIALLGDEHADLKEFCEHEIALLSKPKSASKSKNAKENDELKKKILEELVSSGQGYTISEMQKAFEFLADLTNQRISAIVKQLVDVGLVDRAEIKGKATFSATEKAVDLAED